VEGALLLPKGYLSLRETVIRLAETQAPIAGVRKYLERDEASAGRGFVAGDHDELACRCSVRLSWHRGHSAG
jgi:hypothetical protein